MSGVEQVILFCRDDCAGDAENGFVAAVDPVVAKGLGIGVDGGGEQRRIELPLVQLVDQFAREDLNFYNVPDELVVQGRKSLPVRLNTGTICKGA